MPKYTFTRLSLIEELFTAEADTEVSALQMVRDGAAGVDIVKGQWFDWADGSDYELRDVEDELATWIKQGADKFSSQLEFSGKQQKLGDVSC